MAKYVIDGNTMSAFADEIRTKTGLSDALDNTQMVIDIAAIPTRPQNVPSYVQTEAERVAAAVAALQNENTLSFIAMSDLHAGGDNQNSIYHAAQAAAIIKGRVPIDFTAVLGDVAHGAGSDSHEAHMANLLTSVRVLSFAGPDLRLDGNHDANIYNAGINLTPDELHRYTSRFNRPGVTVPGTDAERGYFYLDLEEKKTRIICLNTADLKDIPPAAPQDGHHVSAAQFNWLVSTLNMAGKTGWKIIVLSHHPVHWYGSMPNVLSILEAYASGTSGSVSADGQTVAFNFSGKNPAKLVLCVNGHTHNFVHGKRGTNQICQMTTPNACYGRNNEYGNANYYPDADFREKYGEETTYSKTANTAKDTAFVVYTVDFENEVIHAICYGAGYDRVMSYSDAVYHIVTNSLIQVLNSNETAVIQQGASYSAKLTAVEGYELDSVTVTMGGVDVTSTAYSNGTITIADVSGDIVITATAKKMPIVVDINAVGYTDNARWSTSDGGIRTGATGHIAVNLIPFERTAGQTITVTLSGINWQYGTNCTLVLCVDGAFKYGAYLNADKTEAAVGVNVKKLTNGAVELKFYDPGNPSAWSGINGFKVSGYGAAADAVITIE
jgi:3',5'-cyclic AMP phosphodiesterase CpdA